MFELPYCFPSLHEESHATVAFITSCHPVDQMELLQIALLNSVRRLRLLIEGRYIEKETEVKYKKDIENIRNYQRKEI